MRKLEVFVNRITEFGTKPNVDSDNKTVEIQKLPVGLYSEYLNLETEFDDSDFKEPNLDFSQIRKNVEFNFPNFGFYHSIWASHEIGEDADVTVGDANDDLSDIIKDLLEIKWHFENSSQKYAELCFEETMRNHSEKHLVNLLKYLLDKNE